jgi:hypothetical protein
VQPVLRVKWVQPKQAEPPAQQALQLMPHWLQPASAMAPPVGVEVQYYHSTIAPWMQLHWPGSDRTLPAKNPYLAQMKLQNSASPGLS